jgi:nitrogen fixation protein NifU and related proteins
MSNSNDLYREELMDIYKDPSNKRRLKNATLSVDEKNPICGDALNLQLEIEKGVIKEAAFEGSACFVSIVSSEILTEHIAGKTVEEAKKLTKEDLLEMLNLNLTTSRIQCAALILVALQKALANYGKEKR